MNGAMDKLDDESIFLYVGVGARDFWKDKNCVFRTDDSPKLKSVPTLIKWKTSKRLEEAQCSQTAMVEMLIEED